MLQLYFKIDIGKILTTYKLIGGKYMSTIMYMFITTRFLDIGGAINIGVLGSWTLVCILVIDGLLGIYEMDMYLNTVHCTSSVFVATGSATGCIWYGLAHDWFCGSISHIDHPNTMNGRTTIKILH